MAETRETASTGHRARVWNLLVRLDVTLRFQTIKRGVDRTCGDLRAGARFDLLPHPRPVSPITKMQKRQDGYIGRFTTATAFRN
jgi:hypothetical protein